MIPALSRFTYTDPNGIEDTYFYEVPQIDDDTEDAKHINEMINYRYGYLVERAQDARSRNDFIDTGFIIWVSNWNGPVLSLQVTSSTTMWAATITTLPQGRSLPIWICSNTWATPTAQRP